MKKINQSLTPYETIKIGSQVWMKKNLDRDTFNNGDKILEVKSLDELQKANKKSTPAWCYYGFEEKNGLIYGKLYNFYAINDKRGLAPEGFSIPTSDDWNVLIDFLGDDEEVANLKLRGTEHWLKDTVFKQYNGNNETKFTALPGGRYTADSFEGIEANAFFWGHEILPTQKKSSYTHIYYLDGEFNKRYCDYNYFLSVRCISVK